MDWKSTAKTGTLMLREMNDPGAGDVTVLLDGTRSCVSGRPPYANFELAVQAAGSAADFALRAGRTVDLVLQGSRPRRVRLLPGREGGRKLLLETLAAADPDSETPLCRSLPRLRLDRGPGRLQSLWVVALCLDAELARALLAVRAEGMRVGVLSVALQPPSTGDGAAVPGATSIGVLLSLEHHGVLCLSLRHEDDLVRVLSARRWDGPLAVRR